MAERRVVVHLTQCAGGRQSTHSAINNTLQNGGEVSVLDDKTLRLLHCQNASKPSVLVAQKLRFDALSANENEKSLQLELSTLIHNLFVDQRDCLLMHVVSKRDDPSELVFLVDALIIHVNVKLQLESLQLEGCSVFQKHLVEDSTNSQSHPGININFSGMKPLMNWLLNEYRTRSSRSTSHEALKVEYIVSNKKNDGRFSVKFHILLVSMREFTRGTLCALRCYFSNDVTTTALSVTELTTYIREAGEQQLGKPLYMLMLCHVLVTGCQVRSRNVQLLGLAHLVCAERDSGLKRDEDVHVPQPVSKLDNDALARFIESCENINENLALCVQQIQKLTKYKDLFHQIYNAIQK